MYTPKFPPFGVDLKGLVDYVVSELRDVSAGFSAPVDSLQFNALHREPRRPRAGMVAYADGTDWNPGAGEGLYVYTSGGWSKLG